MPILFKYNSSNHDGISDEIKSKYSAEAVAETLKHLDAQVKLFEKLSQKAAYPANLCGWRTSCCCCHRTLFQETKQMGLILQRAFKGSHVWIPPISKQL